MNIRIKRFAIFSAFVFLCAGVSAFGQQCPAAGDVCVTFTGGYSTTFANSDGDFGAGIYTANINGAPLASGMICDDYNDEITNGESWNAKAYQVSTLVSGGNLGNTLFGNTIGVTGYAEVATLVSMMFGGVNTYGTITGITQSELASAIWDITTPGGINGLDATAQALVSAVEKAFGGKNGASLAAQYLATLTNLWILTPTQGEPGRPQEMWISVAEGGSALMYLLLAGLFCFWTFFKSSRERLGIR
jgi:hypothetical protein